ncbi:DUF5110 domain-containing protein [Sulfuriroseicoccus oceanibius]|uniref:DUF5110 domain-containing protein n=2 Tax=Sulfuriroseicoccus oceanibius TaxID=2707525 RepID=A0A6B3LCC9_9BACT|nr:DUF5110 domain-containing protein [Sulfuriroseicoccus oceanibius]
MLALLSLNVGQLEALAAEASAVQEAAELDLKVLGAKQINPTTVEFVLTSQRRMTMDFYSDSIFRWFRDDQGGILRDPVAEPPAQILVDQPRAEVGALTLENESGVFAVSTSKVRVEVDAATARVKMTRIADGAVLFEEVTPVEFDRKGVKVTLTERDDEYFYGGGVQNGRFSHKGKLIDIENQNSWTDGGVASPNPYFWSTRGYAMMWHTFKKGQYDFGSNDSGQVKLTHETDYLDVFVMAGETPADLLDRYFQLTGKPVLLPKFGFYLGHLNAYNRDFWKEVEEDGILFEDGKLYKEEQKDNGGVQESLNGEKDNYQFSARAAVERYEDHDMPLGWFLPNDGYGAGYGQTDTLEGNIENLREFGEWARERGVEIGLWTQSDLHPKADISALLQRDLVREVRDAGVRVLKTDVAWVGAGYSFGLNGIADAAQLMTYYGNNARPFIITLDGWAGTQRYGGVWTGDQTGGKWEYIRFHIPTYIGAGLSGMSNICSDMDGIFGGKDLVVNTRDYQWKTFTSMQLNMDGWGSNPKYPHILGEPATSINRWYLKLKAELMPYTYSIAREAVDGLPMVRAMFLDEVNPYTLGSATRYQFLYGEDFLVAPIYQNTRADDEGNDERDNIYLPEGQWIDFFTGDVIAGGRIINNFDSPLWKLPTFVRRGAIIPKNRPHNDPAEIDLTERIYEFYPYGESAFTEYDDDGLTEQYKAGAFAETEITSVQNKDQVKISIQPTRGSFDGFVKEKSTELQVNLTAEPSAVTATIGGQTVTLQKVDTAEALASGSNVYFYDAAPELNRFATPDTEFAKVSVIKNPVLHVKLAKTDTSVNGVEVQIDGYRYDLGDPFLASTGELTAPEPQITDENTKPYTLEPSWEPVANADYYEIEFQGMNYSTIRHNSFLFENLNVETEYSFKIRSVNSESTSDWVAFTGTTKADPYEFAINGLVARSTAEDQGGSGIAKLFDRDQLSGWHTKWGEKAVPFEFIVDLRSVNLLDKLQYIPRDDASNGTLLEGTIFHSMNGRDWTEAGAFTWEKTGDTKEFVFSEQPKAGYVKIAVTKAVGDFGSGNELYIFKVPGSESYIPGDINEDGAIDFNDLTSYGNYTGLRQGDSDFEGYISKGDINKNGLIDALDISYVTTRLEGGAQPQTDDKPVAGTLEINTDKEQYQAGDKVEIAVSGKDLVSVNALSFALPYDAQKLTFESIEPVAMKQMEDFTKDRLHGNGQKALYPTFLNLGNQEVLEGSETLFVITFTAKAAIDAAPQAKDGILVGKDLDSTNLWAE